jgi:hypothetical protein
MLVNPFSFAECRLTLEDELPEEDFVQVPRGLAECPLEPE